MIINCMFDPNNQVYLVKMSETFAVKMLTSQDWVDNYVCPIKREFVNSKERITEYTFLDRLNNLYLDKPELFVDFVLKP